MNAQIKELMKQCTEQVYDSRTGSADKLNAEKFAELIVRECTQVLFDESEKLFGLYSEETNFHWAAEYEVQANQCIDNIGLIEKHFGVEE